VELRLAEMPQEDAVPEICQLVECCGTEQFEIRRIGEVPLEVVLGLHVDVDMRLIDLVFPVEQEIGEPDGGHAGLRRERALHKGHNLLQLLYLIECTAGLKAEVPDNDGGLVPVAGLQSCGGTERDHLLAGN